MTWPPYLVPKKELQGEFKQRGKLYISIPDRIKFQVPGPVSYSLQPHKRNYSLYGEKLGKRDLLTALVILAVVRTGYSE